MKVSLRLPRYVVFPKKCMILNQYFSELRKDLTRSFLDHVVHFDGNILNHLNEPLQTDGAESVTFTQKDNGDVHVV